MYSKLLLPSALISVALTAAISAQNVSTQNVAPPSGGSAGGVGMIWQDVSPAALAQTSPLSVAVQPNNGNRIVVTTPFEGIHYSGNGGQTWHHNYLDFYIDDWTPSWWVNEVVYRPTAPNEMVAITMSGTYWSDDNGAHWYSTAGQRPEGSLDLAANTNGTAAAAADMFGNLWIYDWNTRTWPSSFNVGGATILTSVDFDSDGWLYVGGDCNPAVWTTPDLGATWHKFGRNLPGDVHDVLCDPEISGRSHIISNKQLYVTNDGPSGGINASWAPSGMGLPATDILSLIHHPTRPQIMFAGTLQDGVYISQNRGANWKPIGTTGMSHTAVVGMSICADDPQWLYAACHSNSAAAGAIYRLRLQP
jgi:hypothetical protein